MTPREAIRHLMDELRSIDRKQTMLRNVREQKAKALSRLQSQEAMSSATPPAPKMACR